MGVFVKWYVGLLKNKPLVANMGSALVLMSAGDVMAQEVELKNLAEHFSTNDPQKVENFTDRHRVTLKRYGTADSTLQESESEDGSDHQDDEDYDYDPAGQKSRLLASMMAQSYSKTELQEVLDSIMERFREEVQEIDLFRTGTMVGWAVGAYTPFYVGVYRLFDKYIPRQTPATVFARVLICFILSIPVNAAFFTYGSFVHHSAEWLSVQQKLPAEVKKMLLSNAGGENENIDDLRAAATEVAIPFDWEMMWSTAKLKLDAELYQTVLTSGKVWIPINMLNFSLVPPHLRAVNLMVCSMFWNCYMSLAQHRDVKIPDEVQ